MQLLREILKLSYEIDKLLIMPRSGTLLGLYRDNKLIDHDGDIDLILYDKSGGVGLISFIYAVISYNFSFDQTSYNYRLNNLPYKNVLTLRKKRCIINIKVSFYNELNSSWSLSILNSKNSNYYYVDSEIFDIDMYEILTLDGFDYRIPINSNKLLSLWYGKYWELPDQYLNQYRDLNKKS
jgi:hypothetical protein